MQSPFSSDGSDIGIDNGSISKVFVLVICWSRSEHEQCGVSGNLQSFFQGLFDLAFFVGNGAPWHFGKLIVKLLLTIVGTYKQNLKHISLSEWVWVRPPRENTIHYTPPHNPQPTYFKIIRPSLFQNLIAFTNHGVKSWHTCPPILP